MKKGFYFVFILLLSSVLGYGQTWNGSVSDNWNTAGNWNGGIVPDSTGNVIINDVSSSNFYPKLSSNIYVQSILMTDGAELDVNGYSIRLKDYFNIEGIAVFLNNTDTNNADISITIEGATNNSHWKGLVASENLNLIVNGSKDFLESSGRRNLFLKDFSIKFNSSGLLSISDSQAVQVTGNLSIHRTVAGSSDIFKEAALVGGNFSYKDSVSSVLNIGHLSKLTQINGKIDIAYNTSGIFNMSKVINHTSGGNVNIDNTTGNSKMSYTDLKVNSLNFSNYSSLKGNLFDFFYNKIAGNISLSDKTTNNASIRTSGNSVSGNFIITKKGKSILYESFGERDSVFGNLTIHISDSTDTVYTSFSQGKYVSGNFSITQNKPASVYIFNGGGFVNGNFSYTNNGGGFIKLGHLSKKTTINGKIDIDYDAPGTVTMTKIKNNTTGGNISINNASGYCIVYDDTLKVNNFSFTNYAGDGIGSNYFEIWKSVITGNFHFSDTTSNVSTIYMAQNHFYGNLSITKNGLGELLESYSKADSIFGNFNLVANSTCNIQTSYHDAQYVTGNYSVTRNAAGLSNILRNSAYIGGNFSYTNKKGGVTNLGHLTSGLGANSKKTIINGKIDIDYDAADVIKIYKVVNNTGGGIISINKSIGQCELYHDTFKVAALNYTNYGGGTYFELYKSLVQGEFTYSDTSTNTSPSYFADNLIIGNFNIIKNGKGDFLESYSIRDSIIGNLNATINNTGPFHISYNKPVYVSGNININRTVAGATTIFRSGGNIGGNVSYVNLAGGDNLIGNFNITTSVNGKVDINCDAENHTFSLFKIKNFTDGGNIFVNRVSGLSRITNDTLKLNSFVYKNYKGGDYAEITNNHISGDFFYSDTSTNIDHSYLGSSVFDGGLTIVKNGSGQIMESYARSNHIMGDADFYNNNPLGKFYINYTGATFFHKNLTLNGNPYDLRVLNQLYFVGNTNSVFKDKRLTPSNFGNLIIEKSNKATLTLASPVNIITKVDLLGGNIITNDTAKLTFLAGSYHSNSSDSSKVLGPVSKIGNTAFVFPFGTEDKYIPLSITSPSVVTDKFTANYQPVNPTSKGYDTAYKAASLAMVNGMEFFTLSRDNGSSKVKVGLNYQFDPGVIKDLNALRIARWDNTQWEDLGRGLAFGDSLVGRVETPDSLNNFGQFTLATTDYFYEVRYASSNSPICEGQTLRLETSGNPSINYSWTGPNGFTSTQQNPSITNATAAATGRYIVTVTAGGKSIQDTIDVIVNSSPSVQAAYNGPLCAGDSLKLSVNKGTVYSWSGPNSFTSSSQNIDFDNAGVSLAGNYIVSVTDSNNCSGSDTLNVIIHTIPALSVSSNSPLCGGDTLRLTSSNAVSHSWTGPNSFSSNLQNPIVNNAVTAASGDYIVTITDNNTCSNTDTIAVTINPSPAIVINPNANICYGDTIKLTATGGTSYSWTGPDNFSSNLQNPIIINATTAKSGVYHVTVSNNFGCSDTAQTTITVAPNLSPVASLNGLACEGQSLNLTATGGASYSWAGPNGFSSNLQNPTINNASLAASGTYVVTVNPGSNCSAKDSVTVSINAKPAVTASSNSPICSGDTLNLMTTNAVSYSWIGPDSFSSSQKNPIIANITSSGTYTLTITDNKGCINQDAVSVTVNSKPMITTNSNGNICYGDTIQLTAAGGVSYSWTGPDNFSSNLQNPTIPNATIAKSGVYHVKVTNSFGCVDTAQVTMLVAPNLTPTATISGTTCQGGSLNLNATGGTSYSWTGPDNFSSNLQNPIINNASLAASGVYTVTVNPGSNCTAQKSVTLTVHPKPSVSIQSNSPLCVGDTLQLNAAANGSYSWSGPNSFSSTQKNPVITNAATNISGKYILTVTDSNLCSNQDSATIIVHAKPAVSVSVISLVCVGDTIQLSSGGGTTYNWTGPNNFSSNLQNPGIANAGTTAAGYYTVVVTDSNACVNQDSVQISINTLPIVTASSNSPVCEGDTVNFNVSSGASYSWTGPDNFTASTKNPFIAQVADTLAGFYIVTLTDSNGCSANDTVELVVNNNPPAIDLGNDFGFCLGESVVLNSGNIDTNAVVLWSNNANTDSIQVNAAGTYFVTITNQFGCVNSDTVNITTYALPVVDLGADKTICKGDELVLRAGAVDSTDILKWNDNSQADSLLVNTAGVYYLTITNEHGCIGSDTVEVFVNPLPVVSGINVVKNANGTYTFKAQGAKDVASYLWNFGDNKTFIDSVPTHSFDQSKSYTVTLIVSNDCGSDTATINQEFIATSIPTIVKDNQIKLYPNPAKDMVSLQSEGQQMETVVVYNALGQIVYQQNTIQSQQWNIDVRHLASGMYHLNIVLQDGSRVQRKFEIAR